MNNQRAAIPSTRQVGRWARWIEQVIQYAREGKSVGAYTAHADRAHRVCMKLAKAGIAPTRVTVLRERGLYLVHIKEEKKP